jgi:DNA-binding NarL/FixJ family response regulator
MAETPAIVFTDPERTVIEATMRGESAEDVARAIDSETSVVVQHVRNIGQKFELYARLLNA